jgi:hypothetical protein
MVPVCIGRHRGQIPGTGSRDCHCFHDHLQPGIPAAAHGFPVQPETAQRGPVPGQKPGHTHCKPPAAGNRLQYRRTDGVDKYPVPGLLCRHVRFPYTWEGLDVTKSHLHVTCVITDLDGRVL